MSAIPVPYHPPAAPADVHQLAAQLQRAERLIELDDEEQNITFVYLKAGAGVDDVLLDELDRALTSSPPQRHVVILIDRLAGAGQGGKPKPQPAPMPPQPRPDGHPHL